MNVSFALAAETSNGLPPDVTVQGAFLALAAVTPQPSTLNREGCRESRRCSRDTYPESYIPKYTSIRR